MELQQRLNERLQALNDQVTGLKAEVESRKKKEKEYYLGYLHGMQKALHDLNELRTDRSPEEIPF